MSVYATLISDRSLCSRSISLCYRSIDLDSRGITSDRMQIQVGCVHIENIHSNRFDKVEFQYFPGFGNQIQLLHMYNYYVCTLFRNSIITQKNHLYNILIFHFRSIVNKMKLKKLHYLPQKTQTNFFSTKISYLNGRVDIGQFEELMQWWPTLVDFVAWKCITLTSKIWNNHQKVFMLPLIVLNKVENHHSPNL